MPVYPGSRFQHGEVLSLPDKNGVPQLSVYREDVTVGPLREFLVLRRGQRLEQLAYTAYGDPTLWWVIADANDVPDEYFDDLPVGTTMRIPNAPPSA